VTRSLAADPFCHLPHLQGRLKPAEQSELRVTPEVLALWDQRARDLGRPADWRWTEAAIEASRRALLGQLDGTRDLWVYSYGSLMWDPAFHFAEVRRADLHGFQRRFTYRTLMGRGTPQQPALMLSLEARPGCCQGLAFRIGAEQADTESALLWRREMLRGGYIPRLLPMDTPQGAVDAVVFTANPQHADHVGELPLEQTAAIIGSACGVIGSNRSYLEQLATQLHLLGIPDDYIDELMRRMPACD
jgi:glutathione-specific gamma-glutamylcyclotransferase